MIIFKHCYQYDQLCLNLSEFENDKFFPNFLFLYHSKYLLKES